MPASSVSEQGEHYGMAACDSVRRSHWMDNVGGGERVEMAGQHRRRHPCSIPLLSSSSSPPTSSPSSLPLFWRGGGRRDAPELKAPLFPSSPNSCVSLCVINHLCFCCIDRKGEKDGGLEDVAVTGLDLGGGWRVGCALSCCISIWWG